MTSADQRRYPRTAAQIEGFQRVGNSRLPRKLTNISDGGFFISEAGAGARVGELVVLELSDGEGAFCVTGEVTYVSSAGFGVRATRADWDRFNRLIQRR